MATWPLGSGPIGLKAYYNPSVVWMDLEVEMFPVGVQPTLELVYSGGGNNMERQPIPVIHHPR